MPRARAPTNSEVHQSHGVLTAKIPAEEWETNVSGTEALCCDLRYSLPPTAFRPM